MKLSARQSSGKRPAALLLAGLLALALALILVPGCTARRDADGKVRPGPGKGYAGALQIELRETAGLERRRQLTRMGLPFPRGALVKGINCRVVASDGREIDSQRKVLAHWPDGSVRWLELVFEPSVAARAVGRYRLEFDPRVKAAKVLQPLKAVASKGTIYIDTGRLKLEIGEKRGGVHAWFDRNANGKYTPDELVLSGTGLESHVELAALRKGAAAGRFEGQSPARLEGSGPLRACVSWRGWHVNRSGKKVCPYSLRLYVFRGASRIKLVHKLVLSEPSTSSRIAEAGLSAVLAPGRLPLPAHRLLQEIAKPKRYPDLSGFRSGFRLLEGRTTKARGKSRGFLEVRTARFRLAAALPRAARSAPWEMRIDPRGRKLVAAFWPRWGMEFTDTRSPDQRKAHGFAEFTRTESYERFWAGPAKLHAVGAARSNELWLEFLSPGAPKNAGRDLGTRVAAPLRAWPGIEWLRLSGVFGEAFAKRAKDADADAGSEPGEPDWVKGQVRLAAWLAGHQQDRFGWLGCWDYGDYQTVYRKKGDLDVGQRWWNWHGRWGWMQGRGGLAAALLVPWLKSGAPDDWERFRAAVVHNLDVDTLHPSGRNAGMLGTTHGPGATHWSAPASPAWTYPAAWLDYYYLSGEPRCLDTLESLLTSLNAKAIRDFGKKRGSWSSAQAGYLRARLAAREALGGKHTKAAEDALGFFSGIGDKQLGREGWARQLAPALIRYHRLTGDAAAAHLIERGTRAYISSRGPAGKGGVVERNCFDACAYAWRLSRDRYFLERGRQLAESSAAAVAGRLKLKQGSPPLDDLAGDSRVILELGTLPYLRAALLQAEQDD
jgi:PcRGLX-like N-terminal RIFT barrel domain/PcRGLX-like protein central beta sandwich domain/PcRGLX-like protein C-terminal alpha/alpha toroid domain